MGKKGARKFWERFQSDETFRESMLRAWKIQHHNPEHIAKAAKLGATALWKRYYEDPEFKRDLDEKLRESRSRGGAISLRNLGENGFKRRLNDSRIPQLKPKYTDAFGNQLRNSGELRVAELLTSSKIEYVVEPRIEIYHHAFYPDFVLVNGTSIIEVAGFASEEYWDRTAEKIRMLIEANPCFRIAVVTSFVKIMKRRLSLTPRVTIFSPYQRDELIQWCRGVPGFNECPRAEWSERPTILRGP